MRLIKLTIKTSKAYLLLIIFITFNNAAIAQKISGNFKDHNNQEIRLLGYAGFETIELARTSINEKGEFEMKISDAYKGMGYLETSDLSQLFLVINEDELIVSGTHLKETDSIKFIKSKENQIFSAYVLEHFQREKLLAGWKYLLPQYQTVQQLKSRKNELNLIEKEIIRLEKEDNDFLNSLDKSAYISWFFPLRKLLDEIPLTAQRYPERFSKNLEDFLKIDFKDKRLYHSGIIDDLIESHYWLIENSGKDLDSTYVIMNQSTDYLIANLEGNEKLMNDVGNFLFKLLEKRSLFKASEYLSLKLLTQNTCNLDEVFAKQLESYRAMKIGNIAPDITFYGDTYIGNLRLKEEMKLSEMKMNNTLIIFGSSSCPKCKEDIPELNDFAEKWGEKGVEIVYISLDTDPKLHQEFIKDFPFLSNCDYKSWNTQAAKDYYVFFTPSMFLLNKERKILLRPNSTIQVDTYIDYYISNSTE